MKLSHLSFAILFGISSLSNLSARMCDGHFLAATRFKPQTALEKKTLKGEFTRLDEVSQARLAGLGKTKEAIDLSERAGFQILKEGSPEIVVLANDILKKNKIDKDLTKLIAERAKSLADHPTEEMTIIGGGPMGLVVAIKAWKSGKKVRVIESRQGYVRDQIMGLNPNFQKWFLDDLPSLNKEMHALGIFEKKYDWQSLIFNKDDLDPYVSIRIEQLESSLSLYLKRLEEMSGDDSIKIMRNVSLVGVEQGENAGYTLKLRNVDGKESKIASQFIVGADGAGGPSKYFFGRQKKTTSNAHYAGTGLFRGSDEVAKNFQKNFHSEDLRDMFLNNPQTKSIVKKLQKLGWEKETVPAVRIFQNGDVFYIGAEIPQTRSVAEKFLKNENNEQLQWFTLLKDLIFPEKVVGKLVPFERATTAFPVELGILDKAYSMSKDKHGVYFPVADLFAAPHFMTRSGINHGFIQTQILDEEVLTKPFKNINESNLVEYDHRVYKNAEKLFAKPLGDHFFTDGPFMRSLSDAEVDLANALSSRGVLEINYHSQISILLKYGIKVKDGKILDQVSEAFKANPKLSADDLSKLLDSIVPKTSYLIIPIQLQLNWNRPNATAFAGRFVPSIRFLVNYQNC